MQKERQRKVKEFAQGGTPLTEERYTSYGGEPQSKPKKPASRTPTLKHQTVPAASEEITKQKIATFCFQEETQVMYTKR